MLWTSHDHHKGAFLRRASRTEALEKGLFFGLNHALRAIAKRGAYTAPFVRTRRSNTKTEAYARTSQTIVDARERMEDWRRNYNEIRPHGAIRNKVPIALMIPGSVSSPLP
jgi:transposase InsO family protein